MKKTGNAPEQRKVRKVRNRVSDILLVLAILLLVGGAVLLSIDPIRDIIRKNKTEEFTEDARELISLGNTEVTFVVQRDALAVNGEDYDYFGDDEAVRLQQERISQAEEDLPDYVTLTCIAVLDIDSANIHIPVFDDATNISLRYGGGHFPDSVLPGEAGNCTILAHHMRREESMFHNLDQVRIGDLIRIVTSDGHEFDYVTDDIIIVSRQELIEHITGDITDTKQITLVTCTYTPQGTMRLCVIGHIIDD